MKTGIPFLVAAFLCLLAPACSRSVEPGLYQVRSDSEDGFVRVGTDSLGHPSHLYFRNTGSLTADTVTVQVVPSGKRFEMTFPDGRVETVSLQAYEAPEFHPYPLRKLYLAPVYRVGVTEDIVYGRVLHRDREDASEDLKLDLYYPLDDGSDSRPLLMAFHGGGFRGGDKQDSSLVEWCRHFASLGYVVSSVNYRLGYKRSVRSTDELLYRSLKDAHAAVRFLLKRDSLRIHAGRVFASGADAGAVTALHLAYMRDENLPEIIPEGYGMMDSVGIARPTLPYGFTIRAVANLWGAVLDTAMLQAGRIPVISFQSREDRDVPFGSGYPFESEVDDTEEKDFLRSALEALWSIFLPQEERHPFREMYGAGVIHRILKTRSVRQELHAFDGDRHDLIHGMDGLTDYARFDEIKEQTARFFAPMMDTAPVSLRQDPEDPQVFLIDNSEVETCLWKVEGGAVLSKSADALRVLLFPDEETRSVSVSGVYTSGLTFNETLAL